MKTLITSECHFAQMPDGMAYAITSGGEYSLWQRYLSVFDGVQVVGRLQQGVGLPAGAVAATGPGVVMRGLPEYTGPWRYLLRKPRVSGLCLTYASSEGAATIMRGPGAVAAAIHGACLRLGKPYGVEVLGDPYEAFAPGSVDHPLRVVFRYWFTRQLMRMCREACAVAYVTRSALQRRYPPRADAFVIDFSDVDLSPRAYVGQPRSAPCQEGRVRLVTVGSLAQLYKGTDVLLEAVARCVGSGRDIELAIVGDGRYRPQLAARAAALGLADRVVFRGRLPPGEAVRAELDRADLFVLPSRSEGLPKALLEAMARGLPCIASAVGGIPELLAKDDLVAPGDVEQLACKISSVLDEPGRMVAMSARNLRRASEYSADAQQRRRVAFLRAVRAATEAWEGGSGRDRSRAVRI